MSRTDPPDEKKGDRPRRERHPIASQPWIIVLLATAIILSLVLAALLSGPIT